MSFYAEGNTVQPVIARVGLALRGRRPRACMDTLCTGTGRSRVLPREMVLGTRHESERSTMAMNGRGKSDRPIGTEETFEQGRGRTQLAEEVEGRGLTKGKTFHHNKLRTQNRERGRYGRLG